MKTPVPSGGGVVDGLHSVVVGGVWVCAAFQHEGRDPFVGESGCKVEGGSSGAVGCVYIHAEGGVVVHQAADSAVVVVGEFQMQAVSGFVVAEFPFQFHQSVFDHELAVVFGHAVVIKQVEVSGTGVVFGAGAGLKEGVHVALVVFVGAAGGEGDMVDGVCSVVGGDVGVGAGGEEGSDLGEGAVGDGAVQGGSAEVVLGVQVDVGAVDEGDVAVHVVLVSDGVQGGGLPVEMGFAVFVGGVDSGGAEDVGEVVAVEIGDEFAGGFSAVGLLAAGGVGAGADQGADDFVVAPPDGGMQGEASVVAGDVGVGASGVVGVEEFFDGVGGTVENRQHQRGESAVFGCVGVGFGEAEEVGDADCLVVLGGEVQGGGAGFVSLVEVHMAVVVGQHGAEEGGGTVDLREDAFVAVGTPLDAAGLGEGVDSPVGAVFGKASLPGIGVDGLAVGVEGGSAGLEDDGVEVVVVAAAEAVPLQMVFQVEEGHVFAVVVSLPDMVVGVGGGEFGSLAVAVERSADGLLAVDGLDDEAEGVAGAELGGFVFVASADDVNAFGFAGEDADVGEDFAHRVLVPEFPLFAQGVLAGEALHVELGGVGALVFEAGVAVGLGGRGDGEDEGDDGGEGEGFAEEGHCGGFLFLPGARGGVCGGL